MFHMVLYSLTIHFSDQQQQMYFQRGKTLQILDDLKGWGGHAFHFMVHPQ